MRCQELVAIENEPVRNLCEIVEGSIVLCIGSAKRVCGTAENRQDPVMNPLDSGLLDESISSRNQK